MSGAAFVRLDDLADRERAQLRDGSTVEVRPCGADDEPALREFLSTLCLEARRFRFFTSAVDVEAAAHLTAGTGADRLGLLALDARGALVGHALCIELEPGCAEVAVEVADHMHGQGLGTILIERLAEIAERYGIERLCAEVLPENHAMLEVFRDGFDAVVARKDGVQHVLFPVAAWRLASKRYPQRATPV
jgi:acetate---CoA ligase (ADP-forming)